MEKLDRLGWAAGVSFVSYGARIGIRVNEPAILQQLPNYLWPRWRPSRSPIVDDLYSLIVGGTEPGAKVRRYHLLYVGASRLARTTELDEVFRTLESALYFQVPLLARRRVFVQAGVVGWRGQAIVIPGRSGSGKTSLVAALVKAGAMYYSDEYAVFDAHGRVHPYPGRLSLPEEAHGQPKELSAEAFGGRPGTRPLPVGLIVVTEYQSGARWRPRVLSPGQAILALLSTTAPAHIRPAFALATLRRAISGISTFKGKRGEAQDLAASLLKQAGRVDS